MDITKADRFGFGYTMHFVIDYTNKKEKEKAFAMYCADCLMSISQNTARFVGGKSISKRFVDLMKRQKHKDNRNSKEIIADMKEKISALGSGENGNIIGIDG